MKENEIFQKLVEILKSELGITTEITMQSALLGQNFLDSMDFLKYITCVEESFGISISDEDLDKRQLGIIENMCKYLEEKTNK